jgi:hypothetical protein
MTIKKTGEGVVTAFVMTPGGSNDETVQKPEPIH